VSFLHRLRGERKFADMDALRAQIAEDVSKGLAWQPRG
jgi:FAD synthase